LYVIIPFILSVVMLSHQKGFEGFDSQASSLLTNSVQAELDRWQKIVFFSDMDDGRTPSFPSQSNRSNEQSSSSGSRSTQDQNNPVNTTSVSFPQFFRSGLVLIQQLYLLDGCFRCLTIGPVCCYLRFISAPSPP